jgi:hypothetical protein
VIGGIVFADRIALYPRPDFGYSTQTLASSLAGADNAGFNPLYQIGGARSIQLAAKASVLKSSPRPFSD